MIFRLEIGHAENVEKSELKQFDGDDANDERDCIGQPNEQ